MSYNIDKWKLKKLENLVIPYSVFFEHERRDWHPDVELIDAPSYLIELTCGDSSIKGNLKDNALHVAEIKISGEGSGTFRSWILDNALQKSKGILEAVCVWEGGDSITRLKVKDGELTEEDVEL